MHNPSSIIQSTVINTNSRQRLIIGRIITGFIEYIKALVSIITITDHGTASRSYHTKNSNWTGNRR